MSTGSDLPPPRRPLSAAKRVHLLDERRQILGARLGDLVAQREQISIDVGARGGWPLISLVFAEGYASRDLSEEAFLLCNDLGAITTGCDGLSHGS